MTHGLEKWPGVKSGDYFFQPPDKKFKNPGGAINNRHRGPDGSVDGVHGRGLDRALPWTWLWLWPAAAAARRPRQPPPPADAALDMACGCGSS